MFLIDIDQFKEINDQRGHEAGDVVLKKLATISMEGKRGTDIVARLGGDEFVVLLPETNLQQARSIAERIFERDRLAEWRYFLASELRRQP